MGTRVISGDSVYVLMLDMLGKGETAQVFPAYLEGTEPDQVAWAIKLAKNQEHNAYIEREYDVIKKLHRAMPPLPNVAHVSSPDGSTRPATCLPIVELGVSIDGRKALIMQPLLRHSLLGIFEGLTDPLKREKLALTAARQYATLLQAMRQANITCLDRKLGDLWWVGPPESGHLMVTDWNVVSDTFNFVMDLRRFGLLWFELLIGRQMLHDFQPGRRDFEQIQEKLSYGLWYVIGRALGSSMGPQFEPIQEMVDVLDRLAGFYWQHPVTLIENAQAALEEAQSHLDRTKADWAWIQFDIAHRLDGRDPDAELEEARLWAYDPVMQAAPDLIRKLASPQYSEAGEQLQELKQKVQRPQELGEIDRWQYGLDLLNMAKDIMIKSSPTGDLTHMAEEFSRIQELLVIGVLRSLNARDGSVAYKKLQELTQVLPPGMTHIGLERVISFELEALFWTTYQKVQKNLHTNPEQALKSLQEAKTSRAGISHWPDVYEPTLDDLDRLQSVIEINLRTVMLAGDAKPPIAKEEPIDTEVVGKPITPPETDKDRPGLRKGLVENRWSEGITNLLIRLEAEPDNEELKGTLKQTLQRLKEKLQALARRRLTPIRLSERANILETLLQVPENFEADLPSKVQLHQELAQIRQLESQIAQDQQELFQNPGQVLARALENEYELFDDVGMSVAGLKVMHQAGRWDNQKFSQEITRVERQAERFLTMTNLLEDHKQELEQTLTLYTSLSEEASPTEISPFLANTLRLYLTAAQAQLQGGEEATNSLNRANHLLQAAKQFLDPVDYTTYQDLYEHLSELANGKSETALQLEPSATDVVERQLEEWFRAYRFEDCYQSLAKLDNHAQKKKWETRLSDARRLKKALDQGEPQTNNSRFRKRQNIQLYIDRLDTLRSNATNCEPMAYDLYKNEIQKLYQQIWQNLEQLDKKLAQQYEPNLRLRAPTVEPG